MHVEWVEGEAVVLDQGSGELHYLNGPAAIVFAMIQEHGYDKGLREIESRYGDVEGMKEELGKLIEDMVEKRLLVDD